MLAGRAPACAMLLSCACASASASAVSLSTSELAPSDAPSSTCSNTGWWNRLDPNFFFLTCSPRVKDKLLDTLKHRRSLVLLLYGDSTMYRQYLVLQKSLIDAADGAVDSHLDVHPKLNPNSSVAFGCSESEMVVFPNTFSIDGANVTLVYAGCTKAYLEPASLNALAAPLIEAYPQLSDPDIVCAP